MLFVSSRLTAVAVMFLCIIVPEIDIRLDALNGPTT